MLKNQYTLRYFHTCDTLIACVLNWLINWLAHKHLNWMWHGVMFKTCACKISLFSPTQMRFTDNLDKYVARNTYKIHKSHNTSRKYFWIKLLSSQYLTLFVKFKCVSHWSLALKILHRSHNFTSQNRLNWQNDNGSMNDPMDKYSLMNFVSEIDSHCLINSEAVLVKIKFDEF